MKAVQTGGGMVCGNAPITVQGRMIEEGDELDKLAEEAERVADELDPEPTNSTGLPTANPPSGSGGRVDAMLDRMAMIRTSRCRLGVALDRIRQALSRV